MANAETSLQTVTQLSELALETFCDDISTMFGMSIDCESVDEAGGKKLSDLRKGFRKLSGIYTVKASGELNGDFYIALDRAALFVLTGVFVMLPENIIIEKSKSGTLADAQGNSDAIGEVGNMMVGSWDRLFRDDFPGHGHFLQSGSKLCESWEEFSEVIPLADEDVLVSCYEIQVDDYPVATCAIIYPNNLLDAPAETETTPEAADTATEAEAPNEQPVDAEVMAEAAKEAVVESEPETAEQPEEEPQSQQESEVQAESKPEAESTPEISEQPEEVPEAEVESAEPESKTEEIEQAEDTEVVSEEKPEEVSEETVEAENADAEEPKEIPTATEQVEESVTAENSDTTQDQESSSTEIPPAGLVSLAIKNLTDKSGSVSIEDSDALKAVRVSDVMDTTVLFMSKDETVETAISKMQAGDISYALIGTQTDLEGIISRSDLRSAMSPYLQTMFVKWRRPLDLATLQIRLRWIMSAPTRTIPLDASIIDAAKVMYEHGCKCLPVVTHEGEVVGLLTVDQLISLLLNSAGEQVGTAHKHMPLF